MENASTAEQQQSVTNQPINNESNTAKGSKSKKIIIVILIILFVLCLLCSALGFYVSSRVEEGIDQAVDELENDVIEQLDAEASEGMIGNCTLEEAGFTARDVDILLEAYNDPFIIAVRDGLDNYLAGSSEGIGALAEEGINIEGIVDGLDNFDRSYYESEFMVYYVNNNALGGGKEITIMFVDQPDRLFIAWVYDLAGGDYEIRAFRDPGFTTEEMEEIRGEVSCFLEDTRFRL
ncbi:hypothetical protein KC909_02410 [Candidatus Dojkabacteria bacterium]|uniref:Uncharacterized protein n=1 Tax=Candidatus Dojkabacteria bacterium TaxID=2099670 RepID=A0A955L5C5_9BACT|nr:hypothetical protein [Candidatus Dojkabacteria bacterium]